jgi:hypothetical protein
MMLPRKPKLDARNTEDLRLYSTDDLRHLYHQHAGDDSTPIRLRDGIINRRQIKEVILHRVWWDQFGYFLLLAVSVVAAFAAVIAAIEGWPH